MSVGDFYPRDLYLCFIGKRFIFKITLQFKVFRKIVDAHWYIRNADLHRDLQMEMVTNENGNFAKKHEERLLHHVNFEAIQLLDKSELVRRLKRKNPFEEVQ